MNFRTALRWPLFWSCICLLASVANGVPVLDNRDTPIDLQKRGSSYSITGVQTGIGANGELPNRVEIRELQKDNVPWNLYLYALNRFQAKDQSEMLSYYQVSGIHGRPYTQWDNVPFAQGVSGGYCTHSSPLFPVWHRPYLALYEQQLASLAIEVANTEFSGSEKDEYVAAAAKFRIPYWDWAAPAAPGEHVLPSSISGSPWIMITLQNGTTVLPNPLYQYQFHPLSSDDLVYSPFVDYPTTLRYPTSKQSDAQSQDSWVVGQIDKSQATYSKRFMNLLEAYPQYSQFSNEAWYPNSPGTYDSLESLHDQIHGLVGNGGHMSYLDYSAFDPIFWLHHTNIDRLFSIWQAIYPDSYMGNAVATTGTATIKAGDNLDQNSPLTPFHKDADGNFHTPDSVRDVKTFGYSYPEINGKDIPGVKKAVNDLYGSSAGQSIARRNAVKERDSGSQPTATIQLSTGVPTASVRPSGAPRPSGVAAQIASGLSEMPNSANASLSVLQQGTYQEWITNIRVLKTAVESTFFIHVFLGNFTSDPKCWSIDPNLVGTHTIANHLVQNPSQVHNTLVTGTLPLSTKLQLDADKGKVDMRNSAQVEAYLKDNLHWRITKMDDSPVPLEEVAQLKISVVSSVVQQAQNASDFPVWGEITVHGDITNDKVGGLNFGEPS